MTFSLQWPDNVLVKSSQVAWLVHPPASQIGKPLSRDWSTGPKPEGSHRDNEQWASVHLSACDRQREPEGGCFTNPIRIPFLPSSIEFERFNIKCFSEPVLHLRRVKPRQSSGAEGINWRDSAPMPLVNGSTSPARDEVRREIPCRRLRQRLPGIHPPSHPSD